MEVRAGIVCRRELVHPAVSSVLVPTATAADESNAFAFCVLTSLDRYVATTGSRSGWRSRPARRWGRRSHGSPEGELGLGVRVAGNVQIEGVRQRQGDRLPERQLDLLARRHGLRSPRGRVDRDRDGGCLPGGREEHEHCGQKAGRDSDGGRSRVTVVPMFTLLVFHALHTEWVRKRGQKSFPREGPSAPLIRADRSKRSGPGGQKRPRPYPEGSVRQRSPAAGQRGLKAHPGGTLAADATARPPRPL